MAHGRWYPTVTTLGDGRVMTFSGLDENGGTNTTVEIYTVGSGWSQPYHRRLDAAAVSAHASAAGRQRALLRVGHRLEDLQHGEQDLVGFVATTNYSRHAHLRHVRAAAA